MKRPCDIGPGVDSEEWQSPPWGIAVPHGRFESAIPALVHCETMPRAVWPIRRTDLDSQEAKGSRRLLKGGGI